MVAPCPLRPTDPQLPPMEGQRQTERAHGEAGREAHTADDATKSKRDEKEACDEGILFIEGSARDLPPSGQIASKLFTPEFLRVSEFLPQISADFFSISLKISGVISI